MTVLILAGTGDARQLAQFCADHNIAACASLAGATRQPRQLAVPTYHGGFGGGDGFRAFLKRHEIRTVLDATHPFAHQITLRSYEIACEIGLPYARFERPAWQPRPDDRWISLRDETGLPRISLRVRWCFWPQGGKVCQSLPILGMRS